MNVVLLVELTPQERDVLIPLFSWWPTGDQSIITHAVDVDAYLSLYDLNLLVGYCEAAVRRYQAQVTMVEQGTLLVDGTPSEWRIAQELAELWRTATMEHEAAYEMAVAVRDRLVEQGRILGVRVA